MKDGGETGSLVGTCSQTRPAKTCPWHGVNSCRATWSPVAPAAPGGPVAHSRGTCKLWEPTPLRVAARGGSGRNMAEVTLREPSWVLGLGGWPEVLLGGL